MESLPGYDAWKLDAPDNLACDCFDAGWCSRDDEACPFGGDEDACAADDWGED